MKKTFNLYLKSAIAVGLAAILFACSGDSGGGEEPSSSSANESSSSVIDNPLSSAVVAVPSSSSNDSTATYSSSNESTIPSSSSITGIDPAVVECIKEKLEDNNTIPRAIYITPLCEGANRENVVLLMGDENGMLGDCKVGEMDNADFRQTIEVLKDMCNIRYSSSTDGETQSSSSENQGGVSSSSMPTDPLTVCIHDMIGDEQNRDSNWRAVWIACSGELNISYEEAMDKIWPYISDENDMYGICPRTQPNMDASRKIWIMKDMCGIEDTVSSSSSEETPSSSSSSHVFTDPLGLCVHNGILNSTAAIEKTIMEVWSDCSGEEINWSFASTLSKVWLYIAMRYDLYYDCNLQDIYEGNMRLVYTIKTNCNVR